MSSTRRSSTKPPRSDRIFFTDRDLGKSVPAMLRAAGLLVERHDDHFPDPRTPDEVWIPHVAERGWIALSHNKEIARVKRQRDLAMQGGLALFFLIGKVPHAELARNVIVTLPRIVRFCEKYDAPFIAKIHRPPGNGPIGKLPCVVEMHLTKAAWLTALD